MFYPDLRRCTVHDKCTFLLVFLYLLIKFDKRRQERAIFISDKKNIIYFDFWLNKLVEHGKSGRNWEFHSRFLFSPFFVGSWRIPCKCGIVFSLQTWQSTLSASREVVGKVESGSSKKVGTTLLTTSACPSSDPPCNFIRQLPQHETLSAFLKMKKMRGFKRSVVITRWLKYNIYI